MKIIETSLDYDQFLSENAANDWLVIPIYANGNYPVHLDS